MPTEPLITPEAVDGAYAVKIFLDYHPGKNRSIALLARQAGVDEQALRAAFLHIFHVSLDTYWEKTQWEAIASSHDPCRGELAGK